MSMDLDDIKDMRRGILCVAAALVCMLLTANVVVPALGSSAKEDEATLSGLEQQVDTLQVQVNQQSATSTKQTATYDEDRVGADEAAFAADHGITSVEATVVSISGLSYSYVARSGDTIWMFTCVSEGVVSDVQSYGVAK